MLSAGKRIDDNYNRSSYYRWLVAPGTLVQFGNLQRDGYESGERDLRIKVMLRDIRLIGFKINTQRRSLSAGS